MLKESAGPLREAYDVAVLDLDGVVYIGGEAVPAAVESLNAAAKTGMHLAFVTNNASREPSTVGDQLRGFGIEAHDEDVVTSAQAAARMLSEDLDAGAEVYVIGGAGLEAALTERGLVPVTTLSDDVVAVAQGYGPEVPWKQVVDGAILVREGLPWVATNGDLTIPTARGIGPGNGTLVRLVEEFAGREARIAGKPQRPLFEETLLRVGGEHPLVVGDRLDTDIAGAVEMGWDSLLVLTGVTGLVELVSAAESERPSYLGADLSVLAHAHQAPHWDDSVAELDGWRARVEEGGLVVEGDGDAGAWWRVVATAAWHHLDTTGGPVTTEGVAPPR